MPRPREKPPRNRELGALGEAVKQIRAEMGGTQEGVGSHHHRDHSLAGKIERGQGNPTYMTLRRLAEGLGTTAGEIVTRADRLLAEEEPGSSPGNV
jgi:transcriptional regulator with XRE-family HTH domain